MLMYAAAATRRLWRLPCGCCMAEVTSGAIIIAAPRQGRSWTLSRPLRVEVEAVCKHGHRLVMTEDGARELEVA